MTKEYKPTPREAYECPKCHETLFATLKEAERHIATPVYRLPCGFAYFHDGTPVSRGTSKRDYIVVVFDKGEHISKNKSTLHGVSQPILPL